MRGEEKGGWGGGGGGGLGEVELTFGKKTCVPKVFGLLFDGTL